MILYLAEHWVLIIATVLLVVALSAGAWFLKNWKLALAAIVITCAGFAYQAIDMAATNRQIAKEHAEQLATLQKRILTIAMVSERDAQQAQADQFKQTQLEQLASETPPNNAPCLDAAAANRVWTVRQLANSGPAPVPSRRVSNVFQRRAGHP